MGTHAEILHSEADTAAFAARLAPVLRAGDVIALEGDLGAGKTAFARALIRALIGNPEEAVPSPTFALVQNYDGPDFPITHFDLYRLEDERELDELGFFEALDDGLTLIEWPSRAGRSLPQDRLTLRFTHADADGDSETRKLEIIAGPSFEGRLP